MTATIHRLPYREPTAREVANELGDKQLLAELNAEDRRRTIRRWTERVLTALFFLNAATMAVAAYLGALHAALFFACGMAGAALTRAALELL